MSAALLFARGKRALSSCGLLCLSWLAVSGCSANEGATAEPPSARCAACHLPEYQATTHPPHADVRPTTCGVCHSEASWHPARSTLVHSFPLQGGHAKPACFDCHRGPTPSFEGTTKLCFDCHQKDQASANAQIAHHESFPTQCDTCHSTTAWKPTLPHDEAFADAPPAAEAPASSGPAPGTLGAGGVAGKPTRAEAPATASATWPNKAPSKASKPDQISGASRVKKR